MNLNLKQIQECESVQHGNNHGELFLPVSLVKLVFKVSKLFRLPSIDEFSMLDTLQWSLYKSIKLSDGHAIDEKEMCLMLVNIIRLTEKFNKATSKLTKLKLDQIFMDLGITSEEFNSKEFETFKSMDFRIMSPVVAEMVYQLIEEHLVGLMNKDFLYEFSLDVLRLTYVYRTSIYDELVDRSNNQLNWLIKLNFRFTKSSSDQDATKLMKNQKLMASAVLMVMLKILQVADRIHNQVFDAVSIKLGGGNSSIQLNQLSAIIFDFIKLTT